MDTSGARSPQHVYVDGNFYQGRSGVRRKRLLVTDKQISWRDESIEFYRVTALAYQIDEQKAPATGQTMGYSYIVNLRADKQRIGIVLAENLKDSKARSAFLATIAALRKHVEPRLISEIIARIDHGGQFKVSTLTFSRDGLHHKGLLRHKFAPWSAMFEIRPPREVAMDGILLRVYAKDSRNHRSKIGEITPGNPNSVLAPALIDICSARYGTK